MSETVESVALQEESSFLDIIDPEFDFGSPEVVQAQARNWYARSDIGLLVLRYAEVQELLRHPGLDHNGRGYLEMNGITDGPVHDWFVPMIVNHDGEDHRRLRGLVNRAFTARTVSGLRPFVLATSQRLVDEIAARGECEFVEDFANSLPLAVMCELLGVPREDFEVFRRWTTDIGLVFSLALGGDIPERVAAAVVGLNGYVDTLLAAKRAAPADDLISALLAAQREDGRVSEDELRNLLVTLVFAAHDTTRHQLSNAVVSFAEHPDQWTLLGRRPELAGQAVEEVMRWCPSSNSLYRFVVRDLDFGGLRLPAGTFLMMCVTPAQRDPRVFPGGDRFDITVRRSAPPLQFGGGPHFCLGAALARVELGEALPALATRLGPPSVAGPVSWRPPIGICGPNELPLRFG